MEYRGSQPSKYYSPQESSGDGSREYKMVILKRGVNIGCSNVSYVNAHIREARGLDSIHQDIVRRM